MELKSSAFLPNDPIPIDYTCNGENISPPLTILNPPEETKNLALILEDPDASGETFTHWTVFNIPPSTRELPEGEVPADSRQGLTSFGSVGYGGPCPPEGEHRYVFKLFALDTVLDLEEGVDAGKLYESMKGHVLESAELIGRYEQKVVIETHDDQALEKKPDDPAAY